MEDSIGISPRVKLADNGGNQILQLLKVPIMGADCACQFPHSLDWIEFRTIWR